MNATAIDYNICNAACQVGMKGLGQNPHLMDGGSLVAREHYHGQFSLEPAPAGSQFIPKPVSISTGLLVLPIGSQFTPKTCPTVLSPHPQGPGSSPAENPHHTPRQSPVVLRRFLTPTFL